VTRGHRVVRGGGGSYNQGPVTPPPPVSAPAPHTTRICHPARDAQASERDSVPNAPARAGLLLLALGLLAVGGAGANTLDAERARALNIPSDPYEPLAQELEVVGDEIMLPTGPPGTEGEGPRGEAGGQEADSPGDTRPEAVSPVDMSEVLGEGLVPEDIFYGADLVGVGSADSGNPTVLDTRELNRMLRETMTDLVATLTSPLVDPEGNVHFSILGFGAFTLEAEADGGGLSRVDGAGRLEGLGGVSDVGVAGAGGAEAGETLSLAALLKHMLFALLTLPLTWLIVFVLLLWFGYSVLARRTRTRTRSRRRRRRSRYKRRRRSSAEGRADQLQGSTT